MYVCVPPVECIPCIAAIYAEAIKNLYNSVIVQAMIHFCCIENSNSRLSKLSPDHTS